MVKVTRVEVAGPHDPVAFVGQPDRQRSSFRIDDDLYREASHTARSRARLDTRVYAVADGFRGDPIADTPEKSASGPSRRPSSISTQPGG